jgi:hypothetical protein
MEVLFSIASLVQTWLAFISFPFTYILYPPPGARRLDVIWAPYRIVTGVPWGSLLYGAKFKNQKVDGKMKDLVIVFLIPLYVPYSTFVVLISQP